jgi:hypothetical protein
MRFACALMIAALAASGCEREEPRYPQAKLYPETRDAAPPPPTTSTARPPIYAEPNVAQEGGPKPGQTNNFMSPARPSDDRDQGLTDRDRR